MGGFAVQWRAWLSISLPILACVALVGCAVVDQYSGRAIVYNLEAEQAQDQALLLNIVRAYLHRPMQFTTVSSITGVASVSGGAQYTLPTNVPFRPAINGATGIAAFPTLPTWQATGSVSGGPVFTVPVLDTQEFYDGILKAIPGQIWDLYIQANYPPDLLFNLFVMKAVMHRADCLKYDHTAKCELVVENYVGRDVQIHMFQALGDYLLWLGMTTARPEPDTVPLVQPYTTNVNLRYVGALTADKKNIQLAAPAGGSATSEPAQAKPYKLCFAPRAHQDLVYPNSLCDYSGRRQKPNAQKQRRSPNAKSSEEAATGEIDNEIKSSGSASVGLYLTSEFINRLEHIAHDDGLRNEEVLNASGKTALEDDLDRFGSSRGRRPFGVTLTIYMRHTEGMIYYLGELVRRSLTRDYGEKPREIFTRQPDAYVNYKDYSQFWKHPCEMASKDCAYIFRLKEELAPTPGEFVSVAYAGRWYSVSSAFDPDLPDRSSLSLDFLKQLIAVNSSAKSLPQSSVITTVGGQ